MGEVCACGIWASIGHEGAEVREMIGGELTAALGGQNFSDLRAQRTLAVENMVDRAMADDRRFQAETVEGIIVGRFVGVETRIVERRLIHHGESFARGRNVIVPGDEALARFDFRQEDLAHKRGAVQLRKTSFVVEMERADGNFTAAIGAVEDRFGANALIDSAVPTDRRTSDDGSVGAAAGAYHLFGSRRRRHALVCRPADRFA